MEKMIALRSLYRSVSSRSYRIAAANQQLLRHSQPLHSSATAARTLFSASSPLAKDLSSDDYKSPFSRGLGSRKFYSDDVSHLPAIKDPALLNVFKDLLAASWDELPNSVVHEAKAALSQNTDDQTGKEVVTNVFRAAEAVEEFGGMITNLKMELDDSVGMSGENVKPLSDEYVNALKTIFSRYITYLDAFGPEETYLRKKVETELQLFNLTSNSSGKGANMHKRPASVAHSNQIENFPERKSVEQPLSNNHIDNLPQDSDNYYVQNLRRSVREAALSQNSLSSESSRGSHSDESSEHFFLPLSSSGFSRLGQESKGASLRSKRFSAQTEASFHENRAPDGNVGNKYAELSEVLNDLDSLDDFDQVNGFLSAAGSNCAVLDTQRSFYDFEEAREQVFSPPLLMDSSLLADYEDLLAPLSETETALMEH